MHKLIPIEREADIPEGYASTPVGELLCYHNLGAPFQETDRARILVGMCMDNRKYLHIPDNFAFIIRTGGANLRYSEFKVSYAIAVGGVRAVALLGHTQCGMVGLVERRQAFIDGLVTGAGWTQEAAEQHFLQNAPMFEVGDAAGFVLSEARRLRDRYPGILVAPLFYKVEDNRLYVLAE